MCNTKMGDFGYNLHCQPVKVCCCHSEELKMRLDDGQIEVVDDIMAEIYKEKTSLERL